MVAEMKDQSHGSCGDQPSRNQVQAIPFIRADTGHSLQCLVPHAKVDVHMPFLQHLETPRAGPAACRRLRPEYWKK